MDRFNCLKQLMIQIIIIFTYNTDLEFNLLLFQTGFG